jgi:hypothetical protein
VQKWALTCVCAPARDQLSPLQTAILTAGMLGDPSAIAACRYFSGCISFVLGRHAIAVGHLVPAGVIVLRLNDCRFAAEAQAILRFARAAQCDDAAARRDIAAKDRHPGKGARAPVTSAYARASLAAAIANQGEFDVCQALIAEALSKGMAIRSNALSSTLR